MYTKAQKKAISFLEDLRHIKKKYDLDYKHLKSKYFSEPGSPFIMSNAKDRFMFADLIEVRKRETELINNLLQDYISDFQKDNKTQLLTD